ncbi:hypothetical protein AVEN_127992-1 [Araneus ventricosus]|uniref:Uncharacterized protein n=1 Tax=Araneus ventricosus TaxID=182803 RepID=A0A4Y2A149_ARAVE|nr:hypothetical protein AVEN_127992-1 [Araneus ventricosus]
MTLPQKSGQNHHAKLFHLLQEPLTCSCSDSSRGNSSDTESDVSVISAAEVSKHQRNRKDIPAKFKKSAYNNSFALGLADRGIVHRDLPSIFGGVAQLPDLKLHP